PLRADGRLGGHIVQGHVDGIGEVTSHDPTGTDGDGDRGALVRIALPEGIARYVVARGSLAVDGGSLTVAAVDDGTVTIGLIPETLARTTVGFRSPGSTVNIEVDVLAKYLEKQTETLLSAQAQVKRCTPFISTPSIEPWTPSPPDSRWSWSTTRTVRTRAT